MAVRGAGRHIDATVSLWEGITSHSQRFGWTEFRLGSREIGHVHGDRLVDIPFPTRVRNQLVASGEALPHHVLPDSGWVSFYIRDPGDVDKAIALLRRSYDLAVEQGARSRSRDAERPA